ncbi:hypothetical protein JZ751_013573 [Albula glossodonta]|uniref:Uncharacterized protein n=1 Tax=Albula glossodonta TaxID=121402 RepID=A0A8T2NT68_9TELE|nr:hypothetical protein JZ751_013573 [Albula glossodonta]
MNRSEIGEKDSEEITVIQNEPKPQARDTHGDAGNNRASGTKTRGTDFRLLLPQLEGRQWGVKGIERTTRDTFPARTMNPQGRHPTRPKCLFHRCILFPPMAPLTSGHSQPHTHCQALGAPAEVLPDV